MDEYPAKWRLTDPNYALLPEEDLVKIFPLAEEYSCQLWKRWIHPSIHHYMLLNDKSDNELTQVLYDSGWGDLEKENITRTQLVELIQLNNQSLITIFYNMTHAIETTWGIFLKYWTDFCYCSDEANVIIFHSDPRVLIYRCGGIQDSFWIANRKKLFHLEKDSANDHGAENEVKYILTEPNLKFVVFANKLNIDELIFHIFDMPDGFIVVTELKILRSTKAFEIKWKHDYHYDIIWEYELSGKVLEVTEFEQPSSYKLDITTGKLIT